MPEGKPSERASMRPSSTFVLLNSASCLPFELETATPIIDVKKCALDRIQYVSCTTVDYSESVYIETQWSMLLVSLSHSSLPKYSCHDSWIVVAM